MVEFLSGVATEIDALSVLEASGFLLGAAYLLLAIRESAWCWVCAFAASLIFAWLFAGARIYMDAGLQLFYAGMAVYGLWVWRGGGRDDEPAVCRWRWQRHAVALAIVALASAASGWTLERMTDAAYPYVDSATTWASLWATFLVARKVLENWWYWLVIDIVSVAIYLERGLQFAALLFALYVLLIPFGLVAWTRSMRATAGRRVDDAVVPG